MMENTALMPYPEVTTQIGRLSSPQMKALLKMQKEFERSKDKDRIIEAVKPLIPVLGLIGSWWFVEWGNHPDRMYWGYDQKGSDWSATVLLMALTALSISAQGEGLAKLVDAIVPF